MYVWIVNIMLFLRLYHGRNIDCVHSSLTNSKTHLNLCTQESLQPAMLPQTTTGVTLVEVIPDHGSYFLLFKVLHISHALNNK